MKKSRADNAALSFLPIFALFGVVLLILTGFSPPLQYSSSSNSSNSICYVILLPVWLLSIWYWYRHYKIRGKSPVLGVIIAIIFSGLAIAAMIIDYVWRSLFSKQEWGPCPNCGKNKLVSENPSQEPHQAQPYCPHCHAFVGPEKIVMKPAAAVSIPKQIEELQSLLDKNIITPEEFERKKGELLSRM